MYPSVANLDRHTKYFIFNLFLYRTDNGLSNVHSTYNVITYQRLGLVREFRIGTIQYIVECQREKTGSKVSSVLLLSTERGEDIRSVNLHIGVFCGQ